MSIQLESMAKKGRKYRKFTIDTKNYFVRRNDDKASTLRIKSLRIGDQKQKDQFFEEYLFFELKNLDEDLAKIEIQEIYDYLSKTEI